MSTKIFDGWQAENLEQFVINVRAAVNPLIPGIVDSAIRRALSFGPKTGRTIGQIQELIDHPENYQHLIWEAEGQVSKAYRLQMSTYEKNLDDLTIGLNIWLSQGKIFGTTYRGIGVGDFKWENILPQIPTWRSYGYWNNTDPEEGVPDEEWKRRGEEWDAVLELPYLRFDLLSPDNFHHFSPIVTDRIDQIVKEIPEILRRALVLRRADAWLTENIDKLDEEACYKGWAAIRAEISEETPRYLFTFIWRQSRKARGLSAELTEANVSTEG
jgi:hypothetical protein